SAKQPRCAASAYLRGKRSHYIGEAQGIWTCGFGGRLRFTQFCRRNHLLGLGDLLGRFDRVDPSFKFLEACHSRLLRIGPGSGELLTESVERSFGLISDLAFELLRIADITKDISMLLAEVAQHLSFVFGHAVYRNRIEVAVGARKDRNGLL